MGDKLQVATFDLPLTLRSSGREISLVIRTTAGTTLGEARPDILRAAGLSVDTALFWGLAPVEPSWVLGRGILIAGVRLSDTRQDSPPLTTSVLGLACVAGPDAGLIAALEPGDLVIGRDAATDFVIDDPQLSRRHAQVCVNAAGVSIQDLKSLNGVRRAGICHDTVSDLESGGLIEIGSSLLQVRLMCPPVAVLSEDSTGHLAVTRSARVASSWTSPNLPGPGDVPTRTRRPLPVLAAMMAGLLGVGIAVITGFWMFLLLAALGPLMMITNAISDRVGGRKSHRRLSKQYELDLADHRQKLAEASAADLADSWARHPDPATIMQYAERPSARLWERGRRSPEWMQFRLGVGLRPARITGTTQPMVGPAPMVLDLATIGVAGLCGDARGLLRCLLAQAAVLHSPADLRLLIFSTAPDLLPSFALPHSGFPVGRLGTVISSERAAVEVLSQLTADSDGQILLVFDGASTWRRLPCVVLVLARCLNPTSGISAVCLEPDARRLPNECSTVVRVSSEGAALRLQEPGGVTEGTADGLSRARFGALIQCLESLTDPDLIARFLPSHLGLIDLGVVLVGTEADAQTVRKRWQKPVTQALLGSAGGKAIQLDLDSDGPHFLIAGTTGSGKSELLQTLVATLALAAPPQVLSFLLMDYKGGAAFAEAAELPHTTGLVTDLDPGSASRVLISLRAELRLREKLLAAAGSADLESLRQRSGPDCPPRMVIVVDEFAALATDLPEFMDGLVDIAQRGRSLGVHLVLATQRPAGVVSPAIKANITGRICLRVTDDHDSVDVIDSPLAATLPRDSPGRAYLRTSKGNITLFQTARVAGPWSPPDATIIQVTRRLPDGRPEPTSHVGGRLQSGGALTESTVLQLLVRACQSAAAGLPPIRKPWLPALPRVLTRRAALAAALGLEWSATGDGRSDERPIRQDGRPVLGLIDLPAHGRQDLLLAPAGSVLFWGSPGSGRSTALRTLGKVAAEHFPGSEIVVVDPSGALVDLQTWPQCSTYLDGHDPWLVVRLAERLSQELATRGKAGNRSDASRLVVLIDGWETCVAALDTLDFAIASGRFLELATRGHAAGIVMGATAEPRIQHTRVAAAFAERIELGPPDTQSLPGAGRRRAGSPAAGEDPDGTGGNSWPAGRGRLTNGHEIQLVLDPARPALSDSVVAPPSGAHRLVIRELPGRVELGQLPISHPNSLYWSVGDDDGRPIGLNSAATQASLLVAGPRRSGVSTTLVTLLEAAVSARVPVLQTVRNLDAIKRPGVLQISTRSGPAELESAFARHQGPLLVIADDGHELQDAPIGAVLTKYLQLAGPGQNLVLGLRADRLGRTYRGLIAELSALRRGVLLQPDGQDGSVFDLQLPRRRRPGPAGRGVLADCGVAIPIQVAISSTSQHRQSLSDPDRRQLA